MGNWVFRFILFLNFWATFDFAYFNSESGKQGVAVLLLTPLIPDATYVCCLTSIILQEAKVLTRPPPTVWLRNSVWCFCCFFHFINKELLLRITKRDFLCTYSCFSQRGGPLLCPCVRRCKSPLFLLLRKILFSWLFHSGRRCQSRRGGDE